MAEATRPTWPQHFCTAGDRFLCRGPAAEKRQGTKAGEDMMEFVVIIRVIHDVYVEIGRQNDARM
jgi:hypothetical protein